MIIKNSIWNKVHLGKAVEFINGQRYQTHHLKDIYEFGVYQGSSLQLIEKLFYMYQLGYQNSYGFDSFEGLPEEKPGLEKFHLYTKGYFSDVKNLAPITGKYIKCWFHELGYTHVQKNGFCPAKLVHIDSDLYISALHALYFLFAYSLIKPQTVIAFDEFKSTSELISGGESKAFFEICDTNKVTTREFFRNEYLDEKSGIVCWQNCFIIDTIGLESRVELL